MAITVKNISTKNGKLFQISSPSGFEAILGFKDEEEIKVFTEILMSGEASKNAGSIGGFLVQKGESRRKSERSKAEWPVEIVKRVDFRLGENFHQILPNELEINTVCSHLRKENENNSIFEPQNPSLIS